MARRRVGGGPGIRAARRPPWAGSAAFELGDEEDFAALTDRLVVSDLVDLAVDRDGGFFLQVLAEAGIAPIHFLNHVAQDLCLDLELPHAAGVAPAEAAR